MVLQSFPACQLRHPEDILFGIVITDLQLCGDLQLVLDLIVEVGGIKKIVIIYILELLDQLLAAKVKSIRNIFWKGPC